MKSKPTIPMTAVLLLATLLALVAGCGGGDSPPTAPDGGGDDPVETILIGGDDRDTLNGAALEYITLLQSMDAAAARLACVASLNETGGVASATLFEDGVTIHVTMDSGAVAAFNTVDLDAINEGLDSASPGSGETMESGRNRVEAESGTPLLKGGLSTDAHAPTSRQVLILVPSAVDMPGAMNAAGQIESTLKLAGWDDGEIVVKYRASKSSTAITPDDYLDFTPYGVVVVLAHAIHGSPSGEGHLYIQACSATDYSLVASADRSRQWNQWIESGQLLTVGSSSSGDECFYMRSDLFASESVGLPKTLMFLVSPWGDDLAYALDQRGAGSVLAWDNLFLAVDAYDSVKAFFQEMAGGRPSPADSEVFRKAGFVHESISPEDGSATNLTMFSEASQLYLPAWARFTFDGLPAGTVNSGIRLAYMETTAIGVHGPSLAVGTATSAEAESLVPIRVEIVGSAVDAGNVTLASVQFVTDLQAGFNVIDVDFTRQHVPCIPYRFDYQTESGSWYTIFRSTYTIAQNPYANRYKVFPEWDEDGYSIVQPMVYTDIYIRGDYCYDKAQIEYILGSDPFGLDPNQVIWIPGESVYGYSDPNDLTWDDEEDQWVTYLNLLDRRWNEYLLRHADVYAEVIFQ